MTTKVFLTFTLASKNDTNPTINGQVNRQFLHRGCRFKVSLVEPGTRLVWTAGCRCNREGRSAIAETWPPWLRRPTVGHPVTYEVVSIVRQADA
jgi:hypothetical protein